MSFFDIRLAGGGSNGWYRIMANTKETAVQRAQESFRKEFGAEGALDYIEEVGKDNDN